VVGVYRVRFATATVCRIASARHPASGETITKSSNSPMVGNPAGLSPLPQLVHAGVAAMKRSRPILILLVSSSLALGYLAGCVSEEVQAQPPASAEPPPAPVPQQSPQELDQLVAPIALYPDALIAQILAGASHPAEIVEADRWLQQHSDLKGDALAKAVDTQSWDPGVKALTQFPGLLQMMDKNLAWTSSLGEAYVNGSQNVLNAVQEMRQRAQQAGNLKSTAQESVTTEGTTIVIAPANPQVVYVPEYDPWVVYGAPLAFYPGWIGVPGFYLGGPGIAFGVGIGIGFFGGFGWGWHSWGTDWHGHGLVYGHHPYVPHSGEFGHQGGFAGGRGGFDHPGGSFDHGGGSEAAHAGFGGATRGGASSGMHTGAFSGFNHGGAARAFSSRGRSSFGGGFHGGGGHR
jgi:hypothetical protein